MRTAKKIYLYDDDVDFLYQNKIQLQASGYEVFDTEIRQKLEEKLAAEKPDLVVVDLMTEHDDTGFSVCYRIKQMYPDVPVIIATAMASETGLEIDASTAEERSWIKADLLLAKPLRFEQLLASIKHLLGEDQTGK
ncbi:MAG: response regulator [SAR324 cluster bacterium]|uniref:Response regulator n=1 Tax=SAR324 cluster bacterium TaxID=2024889 RepID=A0A7X9IMQ7_9DELT|nr:response regulator [SAR324 cluster bacterium]